MNNLIKFFKKIIQINLTLRDLVLNLYFRSIIYRKKHIKRGNYKWLEKVDLSVINKHEGILKFGDLQYIVPKNKYKTIPLHQKHLYSALINYYNIPKYFLLFWDTLIVYNEVFVENIYNKEFKVKNGDIILDIGASIGWYACKISKSVGNEGRIIAIEPNPINYNYLKKNIKLNNLNNITALNIGIWSHKNVLNFISKGYGSSFKPLKDLEKNDKEYRKIEVNTIDNIITELKLNKLNLIKMDIEGAEIEAVLGAKKTLKFFNELKLLIAAYHKNTSGIESYKFLLPILEKLDFDIFKDQLPLIVGKKKIDI